MLGRSWGRLIAAASFVLVLAAAPSSYRSALPRPGSGFDYQLGGAYLPPAGVAIVERDRTDPPARGAYNICYINGFQTQPGDADWWLRTHPDLVLRDHSGDPIIDPSWPDEMLLAPTSSTRRAALARILGRWIDGCADHGFNAIEPDNLDSFTRSHGEISRDDAVAMVRLLADRAHADGLVIAQKNTPELVSRRSEMSLDFVIAEECNRWNECGDYLRGYGDQVYEVEYRRVDFEKGCAASPRLSIVLRDRELVTPDRSGYVFDSC